MDFENNILKDYRFRYHNFHPDYLSHKLVIEAESRTIIPSIERFDNSFHSLFIWISILSIISWILYQIISELNTIKIEGISIFPFSQTPCRNCKFYARNLYLKCAVHPSEVLTKQARHCVDYCNEQQS